MSSRDIITVRKLRGGRSGRQNRLPSDAQVSETDEKMCGDHYLGAKSQVKSEVMAW